MLRFVIGSVTIVATLLQGGELSAQQVSAVPFEWRADGPSAFMQVYGPAQAPLGFLRFCEANPEECRADSDTQARLAASPQRLNELDDINRRVNRLIIPATDLAHYGVAELWALADRWQRRLRGLCAVEAARAFEVGMAVERFADDRCQ